MIPLSELNLAAERFNVPIDTVEKDYIISWILLCLSRSKLSKDFVFYGGTAIKRIYFDDHRFSEDIDLISNKIYHLNDILDEMTVLSYAKEAANIPLSIAREDVLTGKNRIQFNIKYLGFDEIIGPPKSVRVDLVMGSEIYGDSEDKKLVKSYSDVEMGSETLSVMTLNTILANKIGLLLDNTRKEPRDVYDIWFLLNRTDQFDFDFEQVRKICKQKYCFFPSLSIIATCLASEAFKINWESRLSKQIAELPEYSLVIKDIKNKLAILSHVF
jgi:uncharacterized protein